MSFNIDFNPNKGVQTEIWNDFVDFIEENTYTDSKGVLKPKDFGEGSAPTLKLDVSGGLGSGKTFTGVSILVRFAIIIKALYPDLHDYKYMCVAPNYDLCIRVGAGDLIKALIGMGFVEDEDFRFIKNDKTIIFNYNIIFRFVTAEKPRNIAGDNVIGAWVDERHIISKQSEALRRTNARVRFGGSSMLHLILYTGTPEMGEAEAEALTSKFKKYLMSTYENVKNVGEDFIENLKLGFSKQEQLCYIYGQIVKITSSTVFYTFDRSKHVLSEEYIKENDLKDIWGTKDLFVSMDFNVNPFVALLWQEHYLEDKQKNVYILKDTVVLHNLNINDMIDAINNKYSHGRGRIHCSPDSNQGRHTSSVYDPYDERALEYVLMENEGWIVHRNTRNPRIYLSVQLANARIEKEDIFFIENENTKLVIDTIDVAKWDEKGKMKEETKHYIDCVRYFIWTWYSDVYERLK